MLEYLRFLLRVEKGELKSSIREFAKVRRQALARELELRGSDLVVSITWNTDCTDVDLHVIEPTGEECYYGHRETQIGGQLTTDVTQGYGPEMYTLKKAKHGKYRIRAKYFSSDCNPATARTKVYATVIEGYGTAQERRTTKVVALKDGQEMHDIALVKVGQ